MRFPVLSVATAFFLGACATVALESSASTSKASREAPIAELQLAPGATVLGLDAAPRAISPSGKASVSHLARGRNAYVGLLRMDSGGSVPTHRDATEEYIHILEGSGTMTIDGSVYEVAAGTTIYMPADAEVSFQNGESELAAIQVFAGPEPAAKYEAWTAG